jgi:dUTP pyrophosphatase
MSDSKKNIGDIFRKINMFNEISQKAKEADLELTKIRTTILEETKEGLKEIEQDDKKDFMTYVKEAIGQVKLEIFFKKIDERAVVPTYAHDGDVGMDMTAIDVEYDKEGDFYIYHTGLAFESPKHYGILMFPRSSNRKTDAYLCNHVGVADSAIYRGEILFCFKNRTSLRQIALESRMISFWNAIEGGKSVEEAIKESVNAWSDAFKDPLLFAPYKVGDRIGQMVVIPYPNVKLIEKEQLSETERGNGAFGSTDKKE